VNNVGSKRILSSAGRTQSNKGNLVGSVGTDRWAVILAGGDGTRLLPFTRKITGDERPKQFCSVLGTNTLLEETRRRVAESFSPLKTMYVLTEKHKSYFDDSLKDVSHRNLVIQPSNIGTTPAILYSLMRIKENNPEASVAFFPSDHYFSDNRVFMANVKTAFETSHIQSDSIILLGIEPESPDEEYGWIEPYQAKSENKTDNFARVMRFWEKPTAELASELMKRGCLWNSFVMVGKVSTFLKMIKDATTELFLKFDEVRSKINTNEEEKTIKKLYDALPDSNFSKDVLTVMAKDLIVLPVRGSKWSDLGSPHRVFSTLTEIGNTTHFAQTKGMSKSFAGGNI
jgi:mannose-1-phosphate guanylyltransferase